ncbi:MAG: deoxyribodipyrimidine photo-lyase, partial [Rickettsiaceae bacterium]|nr:deoxyribodipyrimidine photo-lyase [Rickettsiaceae bacterium]
MKLAIHWFRQDLRLADNPALLEAAQTGEVLSIYILDDENAAEYKMGGASRVWLHHALNSLNKSLGGKLKVFKGNAKIILSQIVEETGADSVFWNRCYEPWRIFIDTQIEEILKHKGVDFTTFNSSLLFEPWQTLKDNGEPYKVFTPFYKKNYFNSNPREPFNEPNKLNLSNIELESQTIDSLNLLPSIRWDKPIIENWDISEEGAMKRLHNFMDKGLQNYKEGRNFPATKHNSRISPYLHFGQISPNQIWHSTRFYDLNNDIENYCLELAWREFSYSLLYYFPGLPKENLQNNFNKFPWKKNKEHLKRWQKGQTGYPIVDAGMRELWQTGFMHNRVRMIVGSFLVKNLMIHWHEGERWFWDCLFDADLANNSASWQWVTGCGVDAAPYFRIFNPVTQGQRFDPEGEYTRKYIPELTNMPDKYLFNPWEAPQNVLKKAGIEIGKTYP